MIEDLYDNQRRRIGRFIKGSDGRIDLYDAQGRRLGQYRPKENRTFDAQGIPFGFGNQLLRLLDS